MLTAQQIARELIHPSKQWHVVHIGDSRSVAFGQYFCAAPPTIDWTGSDPPSMAAAPDRVSHEAEWAVAIGAGGTPQTHQLFAEETVNDWCAISYAYAVFNSAAATLDWGSSFYYGNTLNSTTAPALWERFAKAGRAAKLRGIWRRHASGIVGGDGVMLALVPSGAPPLYDPPTYHSAAITDATGTGLAVVEVDLPADYDWAAQAEPYMVWSPTPGGSNPDGGVFQVSDVPWLELAGNGVVYHSHCFSGAVWAWWADDDLNPVSKWTDVCGLYGSDLILWTSLGVNSSGDTIETNAANLAAVLARFRSVYPDAPIVIDTSYPSAASGDDPTWRSAIVQVAAAVEGVLVLDSWAVRTYAQASALGWIGDGVHYNPDGKAQYAADLGNLVLVAATGGAHVIHSDTLRNKHCDDAIEEIDGGAAAGKLKLRDGTTVVATITLDDPCGTKSGGVLTFSSFPKTDLACDNAGTPDNAIVTDSDDNVVLTLTAGISGAEVLLAKAAYAAGEPLKITSATYEAPP